jgi:site-specific recombinase XerD
MLDLTAADNVKRWLKLKTLVLDSVSSPITRRIYNMALDEFVLWYALEPRVGFVRATVNAWRVSLELRQLSSSSINVRLSAVRKLALEAAQNGLLDAALAAGVLNVRGAQKRGVRIGQWLSLEQAQTLLNAPDVGILKGLRDCAILAVLLGCGLRRSEVVALTRASSTTRE